jgi:hypothetical protein
LAHVVPDAELKTDAPTGQSSESFTFLDLFYAVPVADLAVRVSSADLSRVTFADWSAIAVEIVVLLLSWVGLHQNRARMMKALSPNDEWWIENMKFYSLRFVQFSLEVVITALYFVVGLTIHLPGHVKSTPVALPSELWIVSTMAAIYFAYLLWDSLDVHIAASSNTKVESDARIKWKAGARIGRRVTLLVFVVLGGSVFLEIQLPARTNSEVAVWDLCLIGLLYCYRALQSRAKEKGTVLGALRIERKIK